MQERHLIRIEALKLANARAAHGPQEVLAAAREYEAFIAQPAESEKTPEPEISAKKRSSKKVDNPDPLS